MSVWERYAKAAWKYLLSFRKREWALEDYPIGTRKQEAEPGKPSRATVHYRLLGPARGAPVAQVLTYPLIVIRIEKRFDSIAFDPDIPITGLVAVPR